MEFFQSCVDFNEKKISVEGTRKGHKNKDSDLFCEIEWRQFELKSAGTRNLMALNKEILFAMYSHVFAIL